MENIEAFVEKIISNMSLKEKIGQLNQVTGPLRESDIESFKERIRKGEIGSIILASSSTAGNDKQGHVNVEMYNELQRIAVEESPGKIPMIFGRDVIHGHRTVYPIPLATAASFNEELVEKCYRNIAKEATADGIHWTFSPMLDLCHDPRWGRVIECPGEDPFVGASMATAMVKGFQGEDFSKEDSLVACAKHYLGYGASEGGRDYHRTEISDATLFNYYTPAFRAAVKAGVGTVMSSFNDINGIPTTGSKKYLTDILRGNLGFDGFVVSDWGAVEQLEKQGYATNRANCAKIAITAGLDLNMVDNCYIENLEQLINNDDISIDVVDEAVRRILTIKARAGLFENPYREKRTVDNTQHLVDARDLASESMVLLKNDGVLPLKKDAKIALIGPFAKERRSLLGSWTLDGKAEETPNLLEALTSVVKGGEVFSQDEEFSVYDGSHYLFNEADVIVLALGESNFATGENRAVSDISLGLAQIDLINKIKATGKKVVGVFFCGRPIAMEGVAENLDAVLYAWHSGTETANAVCDILFGDKVPSGRTPITFPRKSGHIPLYYNVTSSGRPVDCYYNENPQNCYLDSIPTPYYPFGYGLSYTKFEYSKPSVNKSEISLKEIELGASFIVSAEIKNVGDYDGKETVQLYIRDKVASIMRPIRELKGFKKELIAKNNSITIDFQLGFEQLGFYDENGKYIVEKGDFDVFVGKNCLSENKITITII